MKKIISTFIISLLLTSCSIHTETNQNSSITSKAFIANLLKGDYETIYEDGSGEMKSHVSKQMFLNIASLQGKLNGKMVDAQLLDQTSGEYRSASTKIYHYQLKNETGETFYLTAEFLRGHLLKNHIEEEAQWGNESDFVKSLVSPVANIVRDQNFNELYKLFDERYPLDTVKSLTQKIAADCDGIPNQYASYWVGNDESGKMFVAFEYAYESKGYLEYRFYIEGENYPFAGIYFSPDQETKLP